MTPTGSRKRRPALLSVICGVAASLDGCARTQERIEQHAPAFEGDSSHTVVELSGCMGEHFKRFEGGVNYVPRPDGATLTYTISGVPEVVVHILDRGEARHVTAYRSRAINLGANRHWLDAVRVCV